MEDLTGRALHLPLLKPHKCNHPCEYLTLQQRRRRWGGGEVGAPRPPPPAGRPEFKQATSGRSGPERSAGVDSGEVEQWKVLALRMRSR